MKMVLVKSCKDCPYYMYVLKSHISRYPPFWCRYMGRELRDRNVIPDWCPLEDAPEETREKED
jgi:hypothetical protein